MKTDKIDTEFKLILKDGTSYTGQVNKDKMIGKMVYMLKADSVGMIHLPGVIIRKKDFKAIIYKNIEE